MGSGYTEEDIVRMYVDEEMALSAISSSSGINVSRLSQVLRTANVEMRHRGSKEKPRRKSQPLNREQYDSVKTSKEHGLGSQQVAEYMGVALEEVNAAWGVVDFDGYLRFR